MGKCTGTPALNKRVTVQTPLRVGDGQGGFTEAWADGPAVHCAIETPSGYERFQAAQTQTPVTHRIVMRFTRAVTTGCRLRSGTRVFSVREAVDKDESRRFLTVKAVEIESVAYTPDVGAIALRAGGYPLLRDGGRILLRA